MPSKKFVIIISSIFGAILLVFIVGSFIGRKEKVTVESNGGIASVSETGETVAQLVSKDSDGDGVPDWEEALWGTDPNKKDANEIEDKKKALRQSGGYPEEIPAENLNETERFSREFFTTFIALKQSGNLSPEALTNLSVSLAGVIGEPEEKIKFFTVKDLQINSDPTYTTKNYALAVKTVASKFAGQQLGSEMEILAKGVMEESETAMTELSSIGESYDKLAIEIKKVPVPLELSQDHLTLINSALGMSGSLKELSRVLTNPLGAMPFLAQYGTFSTSFIEMIDKIDGLML